MVILRHSPMDSLGRNPVLEHGMADCWLYPKTHSPPSCKVTRLSNFSILAGHRAAQNKDHIPTALQLSM